MILPKHDSPEAYLLRLRRDSETLARVRTIVQRWEAYSDHPDNAERALAGIAAVLRIEYPLEGAENA